MQVQQRTGEGRAPEGCTPAAAPSRFAGKGCENAVECLVDRGSSDPLDVVCSCGAAFCFNCKEEAHRPVLCETVRKWITKNSAESENLNWILANTKPCPKCHRPIEKNQGCMHMTCSQCSFEFCWLCQSDWKEHGERTGGFYACNRSVRLARGSSHGGVRWIIWGRGRGGSMGQMGRKRRTGGICACTATHNELNISWKYAAALQV